MTATIEIPSIAPFYRMSDNCEICGKGEAEHEFTTIHQARTFTLCICTGCLMSQDGKTDVNSDLAWKEPYEPFSADFGGRVISSNPFADYDQFAKDGDL